MTEKRFEYIMFDGFTDTMSDEEYINPHQVARLLNEFYEENEQLKRELTSLRVELDTHKHPLWSTREAERKVKELVDNLADVIEKNTELYDEVNWLRIENMRLRELRKYDR